MTDDELRNHAINMVGLTDQLTELNEEYARTWATIRSELVSRKQRRFFFSMADGLHVVGYDEAQGAPQINVSLLEEKIGEEVWRRVSDPGPRVLNQDKLTAAVRKGMIKDRVVDSCINPGQSQTRRMGPRAASKNEVLQATDSQ